MKYIIDVSKDRVSKGGKLELLCEIENSLPQYVHTAIDAKPYTEPDRKAIEDEVWNFVDFMIHEMDVEEREECFGESAYAVCIHELTYQGAKAEYDEWKKKKDEIRVGDEVKDHEDIKAVVLDIGMDGEAYTVYTENRICEDWLKDEGFVKTGRHFPEVAELLEKMRKEEE